MYDDLGIGQEIVQRLAHVAPVKGHRHCAQACPVAGGEIVNDDEIKRRVLGQEGSGYVGANEAGATGEYDSHPVFTPSRIYPRPLSCQGREVIGPASSPSLLGRGLGLGALPRLLIPGNRLA